MSTQKLKLGQYLFSKWDLLPLVTLIGYGVSTLYLEPNLLWLECLVMAVLIWVFATLATPFFAEEQGMAILPKMSMIKSILTAGMLLFGLFGFLAQIIGRSAWAYSALAMFFCLVISLFLGLPMLSNQKPMEILEDDPVNQERFWKAGGLFYFNPKDVRLYVPRPPYDDGYNKAPNFGSKKVWVLFSGSFFPAVHLIFMLFSM
ncbi:MAG: hypothetical protein FWG02_02345 [Holophagaceae bacterium]|nr:hypothetical protein [Holophagaceae bacterium]